MALWVPVWLRNSVMYCVKPTCPTTSSSKTLNSRLIFFNSSWCWHIPWQLHERELTAEYRVCVMDASESVHLNVSCFCKIFRSLQKDNAGVLESTPSCRHFPSLGETLRCRNSWKTSPTSHQTNRKTIKLRKFKVLGHANRLPKLWHPRFHTGTSSLNVAGLGSS